MARRFRDPEVERVLNNMKLADEWQKKTFIYDIKEFIIKKENGTWIWRHKDWKCWMLGKDSRKTTTDWVKRYISECAKPFASRDLSGYHSYND